jgi:succinate dehydrogenase / fumarate reductase cytochrome b subunit
MSLVAAIFRSTLGKKFIMAVTGLGLFAFVVLHMLGNLQIFLGPQFINDYGYFLQSKPELVWSARFGLIIIVILHIWAAISLSSENRAARPTGYATNRPVGSTYASRTMLMSGLIIFCFIVYHLLHFTVQLPAINLTGQNFTQLEDPVHHHDVYRMMVIGFSNIWVSLFYILGMVLLSLHLSHGVSSMFQSLGLKNRKYAVAIDRFALVSAIVLIIGFCSIPIAILTGIIR